MSNRYQNQIHRGSVLPVHSQQFNSNAPIRSMRQTYAQHDFASQPGLSAAWSASQGATTTLLLCGPWACPIDVYQTTAQTLAPTFTAGKGLEISLDQVDNESVEYVFGGNDALNPLRYVAGDVTDEDNGRDGVVFEATFEITDASGLDQFLIGWRKQEAFGVPTSFLSTGDAGYTDFFGIGFAGTKANPNPVRVAWDVDDSGSTTVNAAGFTWADTLVHKIGCAIYGGQPYFFINDRPLGSAIARDALGNAITSQSTTGLTSTRPSLDAGDIMVPFIFVRQDADVGPVYLRSFQCGRLHQLGRGKPGSWTI